MNLTKKRTRAVLPSNMDQGELKRNPQTRANNNGVFMQISEQPHLGQNSIKIKSSKSQFQKPKIIEFLRLKIAVPEESLNDRNRKKSNSQNDKAIRKKIKNLSEVRQYKYFPVYDELDLFPDALIKAKVIDSVIIKRDQDEDVDTDEEVLKCNKRDCLKDLKDSIHEYTSGNPY